MMARHCLVTWCETMESCSQPCLLIIHHRTHSYHLRSNMPLVVGQPPMRFSKSLVNRYQVCSIPPKISTHEEKDALLQQRLSVSRDGLHRTLPMDIWKHNIGSNTGLIDVIQEYVSTADLNASSQYHVWLVDVNIYSRVYKVTHSIT